MTTPKEALELKPCPFCGGQAIKDTSGEFRHNGINYPVHRIRCDKSDCLAMPGVKNPIEGACIDAWNTRATASLEGNAVERVAQLIEDHVTAHCDDERCQTWIDNTRDAAEAILATGLVPDEAAIRADEREKCAKLIEPKRPRPCDCDHCDCHNQGDTEAVAAWDADTAAAAAIRSGGRE